MRSDTAIRIAASTASGMYCASGAATSTTPSSSSACTMPATGERPPFWILVPVRAMAPVAGMPPKNGTTILAMPWAISSWLESCLSPIIWSAATAHSSDSIAPSRAMVKAGASSSETLAGSKCSGWKSGSPCGMPPNLLPMVSTGSENSAATTVAVSSATNGDGRYLFSFFGQARISASEAPASASVTGWKSWICVRSVAMVGKKPDGIATCRPKKSFSWVKKIITAIPLVKPITSGIGKYLITCPSRSMPISTSSTPAMKVHSIRLVNPYLLTMPNRMTM